MTNESEHSYEKLVVDGLTFYTRPNSWDRNVVAGVATGMEYKLPPLPSKAVVVDIGAHIGTFSVLMASKGHSVTSVEPSPDNFKLLLENMKANSLVGKFYLGGVCSKSCEVAIQHNPKNMGNSKTVKGTGVSCDTLRSYLPQGTIDLLKIDCEGCEYDAIEDILTEHERIRGIVGEFHGIDALPLLKKLGNYYTVRSYQSNAASAIMFTASHI